MYPVSVPVLKIQTYCTVFVGTFDSANWPNVAPCRGSSQWSSPCEGNSKEVGLGERGMCRRGQAKEQQRLRMRHGVPDVKMIVS